MISSFIAAGDYPAAINFAMQFAMLSSYPAEAATCETAKRSTL